MSHWSTAAELPASAKANASNARTVQIWRSFAILLNDPRCCQILTLALLLIYGLWSLGFDQGLAGVAAILSCALMVQWIGSKIAGVQQYDPLSALISGLSLCLLLRADELWILAAAAVLAIASKFLIRWNGKHIFNPTNFAIGVMLLSGAAWISPAQWGSRVWLAFLFACLAGLVLSRAKRADVALAFLSTFTIGGLSGIFMANTPVDIFIHDTYFIVAHFHYVVAGIIFAMFAAITYWYPKLFGRLMNDRVGQIHAVLTFVFFNCVFFPMHHLGVAGMMRRIYNPTQYEFLQHLQPISVFMSVCAFILGASQILFIWNFVGSLIWGKRAERNPWQANTLEWTAPSPPPHGNWGATIPTVYRGPYEYSSPEVAEDYLPQDRRLAAAGTGGGRH